MANESTCHMTNEKRLIAVDSIKREQKNILFMGRNAGKMRTMLNDIVTLMIANCPTVDAVEVVRCQNCVHAEPLDHNCELSTSFYMHCKLWRGKETKNVWHKYKKYYKDYSIVERDGYCDAGAKMDGGNEDV